MDNEKWIVLRSAAPVEDRDVRRMSPDLAARAELLEVVIPSSAIADLERDPRTLAASPDMPICLIKPTASGEPSGGDAWGVAAIGADVSKFDGAGVCIAVLDTGVDASHPAFLGMNVKRKDFTGIGVEDRHGHGTHWAGTVLGRGLGIRIGVARGVTDLLAGKVLDDAGAGSLFGIIHGLQWAARLGANIISLSLGFDFPNMVGRQVAKGIPAEPAASAALEAYRKGLKVFEVQMDLLHAQSDFGGAPLVIAATGNESRRTGAPPFSIAAGLPAAASGVVSVGALRRTPSGLAVADFSNTLPNLAAPGVGIVSAAIGGGVVAFDGTSMACPHVAGVAALWWQSLGAQATADSVLFRLRAGATLKGLAPGYSHSDVGWGLVRAP